MKSIKEKAEAYDKVLEWATEAHKVCDGMLKEDLEHLFPELKESEDEKIKKLLIGGLELHGNEIFAQGELDMILAWLEKQGEQPNKVSIWKHWKDGIAGNGEGKLVYLVKVGNTYRLTSSLAFECDYIELSELDSFMFEKQGEQKPAWSEEDVAMLDSAIAFVEHSPFTTIGKGKNNVIAWLKSLKKRYTWKPSDEQIIALRWVLNNVPYNKHKEEISGLLDQIKEL